MHSPLASGGLIGMPGIPPLSTNCPAPFVPPVPSTVSAPVHGGVLGIDGSAAIQISMQVFGVGRGTPVPLMRPEPTSLPPVITGATGSGVAVCVGVAVSVAVDVVVLVAVCVAVRLAVAVALC